VSRAWQLVTYSLIGLMALAILALSLILKAWAIVIVPLGIVAVCAVRLWGAWTRRSPGSYR
jgi:hypothetical protein